MALPTTPSVEIEFNRIAIARMTSAGLLASAALGRHAGGMSELRELLGAVRDEVEAALGGRGELPRGVRLEAEKVTVCLTLSPGRTPSGALTVAATAQDPVPGMGTVQVEFRVCRELEVVVAAPQIGRAHV